MARTWSQLYDILRPIVGNVYYNPPESLKLKYPCVICSLESDRPEYADDTRYKNMNRYNLILITNGTDNGIMRETLLKLPYCSFDREYFSNNMCHDSLTIYF